MDCRGKDAYSLIKGVNRQVVEVSQTDSAYFERILFFVKPEYYGLGESKLREKADAALQNRPSPVRSREKKSPKDRLRYLAAAGGGAACTAALSMVLHYLLA